MAGCVYTYTCTLCVLLAFQTLFILAARDPGEKETVFYYYYPVTMKFFVAIYTHTTMNCYVVTLTDNEKLAVHTDEGMRAIEVKSLSNIAAAVPVKQEDLDPRDVKTCFHLRHNRTVYFFEVV